jgi:hypothetical protein
MANSRAGSSIGILVVILGTERQIITNTKPMKTLLALTSIALLTLALSSCADYYAATERLPDIRIEYTDADGSGFSEVFFDGKAEPTITMPSFEHGRWKIEPAK